MHLTRPKIRTVVHIYAVGFLATAFVLAISNWNPE
jgi:hypothetical protein